MIYVHMNQSSLNMDTSISSRLRKSKSKRDSSEETTVKESAKKRRRNEADLRESSEDSKDQAFKIRETLLSLIRESSKTEIKMFTSAATEPEDGSENVDLTVPLSNFSSLTSYPEALCELISMFTKLRRFPKLIAKLLCCFRDYIFNENTELGDDLGTDANICEFFLPIEFIQTIGPIIASLPVGQMVELLNTLYHNLNKECVKPICQSDGKDCMRRCYFLTIVTHLLSECLTSVKIADYTIAAPTMEKVSEVMSKIRDECLTPLGSIKVIVKEITLLRPFLNLALVWGDLHGFLIYYKNDMYKNKISTMDLLKMLSSDPNEASIGFLHSYLPLEVWEHLDNTIESSDDTICKSLRAKLMVQKLKYMTILGKPTIGGGAIDEESLHSQLRSSTEFILSHQDSCELSLNELYKLISENMDDTQISALVRRVIRHGSVPENEALLNNSTFNAKFEAAVCVETIDFIFTRMNKLKVLPKWCRKVITNDVLSNENKIAIIAHLDNKSTNLYNNFLSCVNEVIEKMNSGEVPDENVDFVSDEIIITKLEILNNMILEDYPTHLKTIIALSSTVFLLVAAGQPGKKDHILATIASILYQTASQPKGNETFFGISWNGLYKWLCLNAANLSPSSLRNILLVVLQNVYVSSKSSSEFNSAADYEDFSMDSPLTSIHLITLEFLLKELPVSTQAKSKQTPQLQDHIRRLTHVVMKALKKSSSKRHSQTPNASLLANIFRACWLTQLALPNLSSETKTESESTNDYENTITKLKKICCKHVESAFKMFHDNSANQEGKDVDKCDSDDDTKFAKTFALVFLHTVCKSRSELGDRLPQTFINQLWTVCLNAMDEDWNACERLAPSENTRLMAKDLFEMANPDELSALKQSVLEEMKNRTDEENQEVNLKSLVHILNCLLDATLKNSEQKDDRREILDGALCSMLKLSLGWNNSNKCLQNMVLPVIEFQTKLVKRRNAVCSAINSATCLSTITSVPLHDIIDTKLYREVFCNTAELLNAFTMHRLDVLSFRMPIYLQCFQFLIESVTSRASQDNKLADAEIIHLKYCAHEMERTCQSMKLNQKEFSRVSPYFVAILMRQFEKFAVYPAVKNPLLSGCNKLLDLCDGHGVAQLNSMLTVGARETFKSVYEMYNKFYRYKGKV